jgi:large subunit ribosomal protein L1
MPKHGKKFAAALERVPAGEKMQPAEAFDLLKSIAFAKFDESVEVSTRLGVDPRKADQIVRGTVVLPHGTGKVSRVLVVAQGEKAQEAKDAGADYVGLEYVQNIKDGWLEFDVVVATPDVMGQVGQLGRILGPRGLMPNAKTGTVTFDVARAVQELKAGKIEFRVEKAGIVHVPMGKVSFGVEKIVENLTAFLETIIRLKPASSKGTYLKGVAISTTMGPGIKIDTALVKDLVK